MKRVVWILLLLFTPTASIILKGDETFLLPVFPLRKSVRLPTERMTLNLYEERYLAMSKYILERKPLLFGALYVSDKPQLVQRGGSGPIVPMLNGEEIGVLCLVREWEEGLVPCRDPKLGDRRRIRLNAIGVSRFRIEEVISDGTTALSDNDDKENNYPFILVKASLVTDQIDEQKTKKTDEGNWKQFLRRLLQQRFPAKESKERSNLETIDFITSQLTIMGYDNYDEEILSFAAATIFCPNGVSPKLRSSLLEMDSTMQRLDQVDEWK